MSTALQSNAYWTWDRLARCREAEAAAVALQMRVGERNHSARLLVSPPLPLPEPSENPGPENPVEPPSAEELAAQLALALVLDGVNVLAAKRAGGVFRGERGGIPRGKARARAILGGARLAVRRRCAASRGGCD